jgi:host factor-I protein
MKIKNCQDIFLNTLRQNKVSVTIFLSTGIKLQGLIYGFDNFSLLLKREDHIQLVYKHSISTIMPNSHINIDFTENEIDL